MMSLAIFSMFYGPLYVVCMNSQKLKVTLRFCEFVNIHVYLFRFIVGVIAIDDKQKLLIMETNKDQNKLKIDKRK